MTAIQLAIFHLAENPFYLPDLASSVYRLFLKLKEHVREGDNGVISVGNERF